MKSSIRTRTILAATAALGGALAFAAPATASAVQVKAHGATVYTESNSVSGNTILAFHDDGRTLVPAGTYRTGGLGSGLGLGSQGAVTVAHGGRVLLAVNAGSNTVSALRISADGTLTTGSTVASGGRTPVSVAVSGDLVYVLNAGDNSISGFRLRHDILVPIAGSTRALSAGAAGAAQVGFSPDGRYLVVTEKTSNSLDVFTVGRDGSASAARSTASVGAVPFGFDFDSHGDVVVSDAAASAVTTYRITASTAHEIAYVPDGQAAACWLVVSKATGTAYVANAGTGTISTYDVSGGRLSLTQAVAATVGGHPTDEALSGTDVLYIRDASGNRLQAVDLRSPSPAPVDGPSDLPAGAAGIAVVRG